MAPFAFTKAPLMSASPKPANPFLYRFIHDALSQQKDLLRVALAALNLIRRIGEPAAPELSCELRKSHFLPASSSKSP